MYISIDKFSINICQQDIYNINICIVVFYVLLFIFLIVYVYKMKVNKMVVSDGFSVH